MRKNSRKEMKEMPATRDTTMLKPDSRKFLIAMAEAGVDPVGLAAESGVSKNIVYGMKWLQRRTIVIDPARTPCAYKEIIEYEYDRDKDGNFLSGYPDKNNHCIDSLRYALNRIIFSSDTKA